MVAVTEIQAYFKEDRSLIFITRDMARREGWIFCWEALFSKCNLNCNLKLA